MKTFVEVLCMAAIISASQVSIAGDQINAAETGTVEERIAKLSPQNKKRVAAATRIGGDFMHQYLNGVVCDGQNPGWDDLVGKLLEPEVWNSPGWCDEKTAWGKQGHELLACDQPTLIDFKVEKEAIVLRYQTRQIGEIKRHITKVGTSDALLGEFSTEGDGKTEEIVMAVNENNKVNSYAPSGAPDERGYSVRLHALRFASKNADESPDSFEARRSRNQEMIPQIQQQAAKVCK